MSEKEAIAQTDGKSETTVVRQQHPVTIEVSPEETIKRMRAFPERAAKLRETIRAIRESSSR